MNEPENSGGWQARLDLEYALRGGKTRLTNKRQYGPLTLQRSFYPEGDVCHNYILHPPGGVVGGDSLRIDLSAGPEARCLLTTPGATRFYRSKSGRVGSQSQNIAVADDALVEWLPQQNIFFPGADVSLQSHIDIARGGFFIGWEMHCFGLPAGGEAFTRGRVRCSTRVAIAGELRLIERLNSNADETLMAATGLRGMSTQGCVIAGPCQEIHRAALAFWLQSEAGTDFAYPVGLTLVDEILIVRATGDEPQAMFELFTRVWGELRRQCLQQAPCAPRIWAT